MNTVNAKELYSTFQTLVIIFHVLERESENEHVLERESERIRENQRMSLRHLGLDLLCSRENQRTRD